jgi:hypothetical protein
MTQSTLEKTPSGNQHLRNAIAQITVMIGQGALDIDAGNALIAGFKEFIAARIGTDLEARISLLEGASNTNRPIGVQRGLGLTVGPLPQNESAPQSGPSAATNGPTIDVTPQPEPEPAPFFPTIDSIPSPPPPDALRANGLWYDPSTQRWHPDPTDPYRQARQP